MAKKDKPVVNLFDTAAVTNKVEPKGKKKKERHVIALGRDLDAIAAAKALTEALEGFSTPRVTSAKSASADEFIVVGQERGAKPDNFDGIGTADAGATAKTGVPAFVSTSSVQLKARASNRPLTDDEAKVLEDAGIEYDNEEVEPETFYFNPDLLKDPAKQQAISEALSSVPELKGVQVVMKREAKVVRKITDKTIDEIFAKKFSAAKTKELLAIATTIALRPQLTDVSLENVFKVLKDAGLTLVKDKK